MVLEKVIEILADQLSVDPSIINEDSNLIDDLDADSLTVIDLIMCLEDEFGITIPDDEVENLVTVADVAAALEKLVK